MHKVLAANKNARALGSDRRDDMRYALRAKISQKDYVDKDMKNFHYGKNGKQIRNGQVVDGLSNQMQVSHVEGGDIATKIAAA